MEETSLSDFVGEGESESGGDGPEESAGNGSDASATADDRATAEPGEADIPGEPSGEQPAAAVAEDEPDGPTITATWVPEGGTCERCGEPAGWRWTDADGLVCRGCKDW